MATGTEAKIADALLRYLSGLTFSPVLPVGQPNVSFKPTGNHLAATFLPAPTISRALGFAGSNQYVGILQIDVAWREKEGGTGDIAPLEVASQVIAAFKRGTRIYGGGIAIDVDSPPYVSPAIQEPPWRRWPVSIPYKVFLPNT